MDTKHCSMLRRTIYLLVAGAALSGCAVYAPPYAYDSAPAAPTYYYPYGYSYYDYGYPAYYGPPVSLSFGYYHGYRGGYGWRGRGGWRGRR